MRRLRMREIIAPRSAFRRLLLQACLRAGAATSPVQRASSPLAVRRAWEPQLWAALFGQTSAATARNSQFTALQCVAYQRMSLTLPRLEADLAESLKVTQFKPARYDELKL